MPSRLTLYCLLAFFIVACGSTQRPATVAVDEDDFLLSERPALQMYLVLTHSRNAMQMPADIENMWKAVHGELSEYASIRRLVKWAPANYAIDVELDFANLPHPALPATRIQPLLRGLSPSVRAAGENAPLAISIRSESTTLPQGEQIRLVGTALLYIAEAYDGIIIDLIARRAWTSATWRSEMSRKSLSARQTRLVVGRRGLNGYRLRSRGHLKYGLPDLELDASRSRLEVAKARLASAQQQLMETGTLDMVTEDCQGKGYDGHCVRIVLP